MVATLGLATPGGATAREAAKPKSGGTLTMGVNLDPRNYDPVNLSGTASAGNWAVPAIYGGLFYVDQKTAKVVPWFAESIATTDNGTTWTIKIRKGIKFSDGTPYDADALIYNWDRFKDASLGGSNTAGFVAKYDSYTKVDDLTVTVKLKAQDTQYPYALAYIQGENYLGSPTAEKAQGAAFGANPVGAGPFTVKSYIPRNRIDLVKNTSYWDAPRPYLDSISYVVVSDTAQRVNGMNAGEYQATWYSDIDSPRQLMTGPNAIKYQDISAQQVVGAGFQLNVAKPPLDDLALRTALWRAISPEVIHATLYPSWPLANAFFPKGSEFYSNENVFPKENLKAAQIGVDAYLQKTGQPKLNLVVDVTAGFAVDITLGTLIKANLERVKGVSVTVNPLTNQEAVVKRSNGDFMFTRSGVLGPWPYQMSALFSSTGVADWGKCSDPKLDSSLKAGQSTTDHAKQVQAYADAGVAMAKNQCYWPMSVSTYQGIFLKTIKGIDVIGDSNYRPDMLSTSSTK